MLQVLLQLSIYDIGDVARSIDIDKGDEETMLVNPLVIAVPQLDSYRSSLVCKARALLPWEMFQM